MFFARFVFNVGHVRFFFKIGGQIIQGLCQCARTFGTRLYGKLWGTGQSKIAFKNKIKEMK